MGWHGPPSRRLRHRLEGELLEAVAEPLDSLYGLATRRADLDEPHPRRGGLARHRLDDGPEDASQPRVPRLLATSVGVGDRGPDHLEHRVERRDEAVALVREVSVEGAARDAREVDDVGHPAALIAVLGHHGHGRAHQPLALVAVDV